MRIRFSRALLPTVWVLAVLFAVRAGPTDADPLDFDLPDGSGHFYRQANGQSGAGEAGFALTNADGIPFWDEYQRLGGPQALGYPVSRRFAWDGFTVQALQKAVFQWRPETRTVAFVNVLDRLHELGKDDWLGTARQTPPPFDWAADRGRGWDELVARHVALLEASPAIQEQYWSDPAPLDHFGLPVSSADMGSSFVVRAQRAVFQYWKEDVPWARQGEVTIANAGDLAKEAGLFPGPAITPELPSDAGRPPAPPCAVVPIRGFGVAWSAHPEVADLLGCPWPMPGEQATDVALQRFEHGWMLWVGEPSPWGPPGAPQILVLLDDDQTFATFEDTWAAGADPVSTGLVPPAGRREPERGFGKVWREGTGARVRERLGWATQPEHTGRGAWQPFERGRMVWTPEPRLVFVLGEHTPQYQPAHAWRVFRDTYRG
jgi:hypothetical protein